MDKGSVNHGINAQLNNGIGIMFFFGNIKVDHFCKLKEK